MPKNKRRHINTDSTPSQQDWVLQLEIALTAVLIFAVPLILSAANTTYNHLKMVALVLGVGVLFVLWGLRVWRTPQPAIRVPVLLWPALGLVAVAALSLTQASNFLISLQGLGILLVFVLFYWYLTNQIAAHSTYRLYLASGLCAAVVACGYGWLQFVDVVPGSPTTPDGPGAMISSLGNLNFFSEYVALWVFPGLLLAAHARSLSSKILLGLAVLVCLVTLWPLATIGVGVGLLLGALGAATLAFAPKILGAGRASAAAWGGLILTTVLLGAWMQPSGAALPNAQRSEPSPSILWMQPPWHANPELLTQFEEAGSVSSRALDWILAGEMLWAHPWLGIGINQYESSFFKYREQLALSEIGDAFDFPGRKSNHVHNDYLEMLTETGVVGGIALLVLVWFMLVPTAARVRREPNMGSRWTMLALWATVLALCADAVVNFPFHLPASGMGFVVLLAILDAKPLHGRAPSFKWSVASGKGLAIAGVGLGVVLFTLGLRDWQADLHLERGNQHLLGGRYQLALGEYEQSLSLDLAPAEVYFRQGAAHFQMADYDAAERSLLQSIEPFLVEDTFWNLAGVKAQQGDLEAAKVYLARLQALRPVPEIKERAEDLLRQIREVEANP